MRHSLHAFLHASAERDPDRPVFISKGEPGPGQKRTTYAELVRDAARFAASLRARGVVPGDRVAIVLDTSVEFLVAYYGALQAGAAAVPLCPDTRAHTLCTALAHSGAVAAVLEPAGVRILAGHTAETPALRFAVSAGPAKASDEVGVPVEELSTLAAGPEELLDAGAGGDDLASIVYTSGTTGRPKGVMLAHRNLCANIESIVEYLALGPRDTVAMVLPPYYVYGNSVMHTHIRAGGTIAAVGTMTFPGAVLEGIQQHQCTGMSGVPATFARLLAFSALDKYDLSSLRMLTQAGAAMSPELAHKLRARIPHVQLFVMYGQAEAAARLSYLPPGDLDRKRGSAGKAIPHVTLRILDRDGNEVPRGVVGEIVAQGDNVMLGYWNDPEETARVLRPEGLRTGDLASMDEEGFLFIQGRESEMIKSGAHRIAPREIEEVIEAMPEVAEVAVTGVPDELLGEAIVAFVVPATGATVDPQKVQRRCLEHLPRFKVPTLVREIAALPRTPTGKVKRLDLRALVGS